MMTFTITDFLISLPITAIIIFAIKLVYKRAGISPTPMGCLIGVLIMFWFVLCAIGGCSERKRTQSESHLAHIKLVTTGAIVKIPKSELVGADTIYREKKHVYKNDTGRDLVEYMVKYTTNGQDADHKIIGLLIRPNQYFYWYDDDKDYHMFTQPPSSTTIVTRSRYGRSHQLDFTYLHFLDYAENVPDYVVIPNK